MIPDTATDDPSVVEAFCTVWENERAAFDALRSASHTPART